MHPRVHALQKEKPAQWEAQAPQLEPAAAKSLQSCPTLCDPIGGSPPGSPVPGILRARILEWAAISFSSLPQLEKSLSNIKTQGSQQINKNKF